MSTGSTDRAISTPAEVPGDPQLQARLRQIWGLRDQGDFSEAWWVLKNTVADSQRTHALRIFLRVALGMFPHLERPDEFNAIATLLKEIDVQELAFEVSCRHRMDIRSDCIRRMLCEMFAPDDEDWDDE